MCGYPHLTEPPYNEHGCASHDICPCCGTQFGYDDAKRSHMQLRRRWALRGMKWWNEFEPPSGWNPAAQLEAAGLAVPPPEDDQVARDAMVAEIHRAFAGVSREGGVSWSGTVAKDAYQVYETWQEAAKRDLDTSWTNLIDDPGFRPFPGVGGFCFIDAIGFRYYLPVTMVRMVQDRRGNGENEWFPGHLLGTLGQFSGPTPGLFNEAQIRCIARFMQFMTTATWTIQEDSADVWQEALDRGWSQHLAE